MKSIAANLSTTFKYSCAALLALTLLSGCEDNRPTPATDTTNPPPTAPPLPPVGDIMAPSLTILAPTRNATFATDTAMVTLSGSATDNVGLRRVRWSNGSASGMANGTTNWSITLTLNNGSNPITISAEDNSGNTSSRMLTVTYTPPVPPTPPPAPPAPPTGVNCNDSTVHCVPQEFASLQAAANAARAGHLVAVNDGNYAGFDINASGSAAAMIRFRAEGNNVMITSAGQSGDGIRLNNASYILIEGFTIQNNGSMSRCIAARGATATSPMYGNVIRNNRCSGANNEGIYVSQFNSGLIEGNTISQAGAAGASKSHGIYLANAGSDATTIRSNTIFSNTAAESEGIHCNGDASIGGDGMISNLMIENNVIYGNQQNGINMDGVENATLQNNLIYNNGRHAVRGYRIDASSGPRALRIINNTLIAGNGNWAVKLSEDRGGHVIFNNILLGSGGALSLANTDFVSNNNAVSNALSFDNQASVLPLNSWRATNLQDMNSFTASSTEIFNNGSYLLRSNSAARDAGRNALNNVTAPTRDITGNSRPQGTAHDLGAYETP